MSVRRVGEAEDAILFKRSMASVTRRPNPLFYRENTPMFFGDAKSAARGAGPAARLPGTSDVGGW